MSKSEVEAKSVDGHIVYGTYTAAKDARCAILMVHGITADRTEWGYYQDLAVSLKAKGVSSLAIDLRGHGKSELNATKLSLSGVMLDISAAWDLLSDLESNKKIKRFVIGNSFGGGVVYLFGNQSPSVDHIYLTAPVLSYIDDIGEMSDAWNDSELSTFRYVKFDLSSLLVPEMHYFDSQIIENDKRVPFTIIHGQADADVPYECSQTFVNSRPQGNLVGLEGMDHCWAKPGDLPPFEDTLSVKNRVEAVKVTVEQILSRLL